MIKNVHVHEQKKYTCTLTDEATNCFKLFLLRSLKYWINLINKQVYTRYQQICVVNEQLHDIVCTCICIYDRCMEEYTYKTGLPATAKDK